MFFIDATVPTKASNLFRWPHNIYSVTLPRVAAVDDDSDLYHEILLPNGRLDELTQWHGGGEAAIELSGNYRLIQLCTLK